MNQGARDSNDETRHFAERIHREQVVRLLAEIRDLLRWHFRDDPIKEPGAANAVREDSQ